MRHRIKDKKFNRSSNQRKSLLHALLQSLIQELEIVTTVSKAKVLKRLMERLVHRAKDNTIATRRLLATDLGNRQLVNTLVDYIAPQMKDRVGGYVTTEDVGKRRGDNVMMTRVKFMSVSEKAEKPLDKVSQIRALKTTTKAKSAQIVKSTTTNAKVPALKKDSSSKEKPSELKKQIKKLKV